MASPKLLSYVREQMRAGYSAAVIKQSALAAGWKPQDIDSAIAAVQAEAPQPVTTTNVFIDLLRNPISAITAAKNKNWTLSLLVAAAGWALLGLMPVIAAGSLLGLLATIIIVVLGIVMVAFFALLMKILIGLLGGKGGYYEAFTALGYGGYTFFAGVFIAYIINLVLGLAGGLIATIGGIAAGVITIVFLVMGIGVIYRGFMELFQTDLLTVVVSISIPMMIISILVLMASVALTAYLSMMGLSGLAGGMGGLGSTGSLGGYGSPFDLVIS